MPNKDDFYLGQDEPNKSCLLAMRDIVLCFDNHITETLKYGMPCFCYKGKICLYLGVEKKSHQPYFLWAEGKHLHHPELESGNRKRMKIFKLDPKQDLPLNTIELILNDALDLYRNGTITIK
jgi:hypothetical protein